MEEHPGEVGRGESPVDVARELQAAEPRHLRRLVACALPALLLWWVPVPEGVQPEGWRLLGIFAGVVVGFLLRPLPMGPMVLLGLLACAVTRTLAPAADDGTPVRGLERLLSGYAEPVVWLVVGAFVIAGAVRDTQLGRRLALLLVKRLGRSTLGLAYAQVLGELLLGPVVPSNTARGGGILAPIAGSLASAMGSEPGRSPRRAGAFLCLVGAHANLVSAAMFLTGMAANPLFARAVSDVYGVEFGWGRWALGALVPGLVALALLPLLLRALAPPTVSDGRPAQARARSELERMGPWSRPQLVMAAVFVLMLLAWSTSGVHHMKTALVAWLGVGALLLSGAQPWTRMVRDWRTWDTFIWLGGLLTMADGLKELGVIAWFAESARGAVSEQGRMTTLLVLAAVYFYSMYGFSMLTAHISAMAGAFLLVCHAAGVPALLAAPLLACFSNLCACTTNYSTGPVIIYFGMGYVPVQTWFRVGFVVSLFHMLVWIPVGLAWWKLLGWW